MTVNWSDLAKVAADGGFQLLPHGEYDVYVHTATAGKTSNGKDRIRVVFKVENGPHAGTSVTNDFNITADNATAMSIFFRQMTSLGLDAAYFAANPSSPIEKVATDLQNGRARARVKLSSRTWQGQERNNVDAVLPAMPGTAASAPPVPASNGGSGTMPPVPQVPVPATGPNPPVPSAPKLPDDLPFLYYSEVT